MFMCFVAEVYIDDSVCDFLETIEVKDADGFTVPLVGNTTIGGRLQTVEYILGSRTFLRLGSNVFLPESFEFNLAT